VSWDLFRRRLEDDLAERRFGSWLIPLNQRGGLQTQHELGERLSFETAEQWRAWVARMEALGALAEQTQALMRRGLAEGVVPPRIVMERVPDQIALQLVERAEDSPWWRPFEDLPDSLSPAERERLRAAARRAIEEVIVPAYRRFGRFFEQEYLPGCRGGVAASELPDGRAFYEHRVRRFTTTSLTPDEVHAIGLSEVSRLRGDMQGIIEEVGFEGSFAAFLDHLRTDARFHVTDPDELLARYRAFSKRVDPALVKLFGRLPRAPYGVRPIPAESAPDTTTAYYTGPSPDGTRPGWYWVNLYRPETRYLWEIPALSLHEAVPGHHLQIALAQELGELPDFRRHAGYTAFVEGWALYAESLGEEMDLYDDPHDRFGRLTYEMWRAVRLVVDTGMHWKGWSRDRAIEYFAENAPRSRLDIENEIDRYIAWPGQALAYKIGQLRIVELRRRAEETLGEAFDLRAFHDVVLGSGAVPLDVLEANVRGWIEGGKP
jgi:uncharacterized protein (DUF885 family)